jgi:hypothetical protein
VPFRMETGALLIWRTERENPRPNDASTPSQHFQFSKNTSYVTSLHVALLGSTAGAQVSAQVVVDTRAPPRQEPSSLC